MTRLTNRNVLQLFAVLIVLIALPSCKQTSSSLSNDTVGSSSNTGTPPSTSFAPIQISAAPQDQFGYPGQTATFAVTAKSDATLQYQWYLNGNALSGKTSATLTFQITNSANAGTYSVVVSNSSTSATTSATLTVGALPAINSQPQTVAVYPGETANISVGATGTDLHYQWQQQSNGQWTNLNSATGKTLTISNPGAGTYRVVVANAGGSVTSNSAAVTLKQPLAVIINPVSQQVASGGTVTLTGDASGGYGVIYYRWYKGNYPIYDSSKYTGTATHKLTINNTSSADASLYKVKVYTADGRYVFTNAAQLSVSGPAKVTVQPTDTALYSGQSGALLIGASGDNPLSFQWQKLVNGSWQNIAGATSASLGFSNVSSTNAGQYRCQVSNAVATDTSAAATVQVLQAVKITSAPKSTTATSGDSVNFSVSATGDSLKYEWTKDGQVLPVTSNTLAFASVRSVDQATYGCRVYNNGSSASCTPFTLTVNEPLAITRQPISQSVYQGGSATLEVTATGTPTPTVDWYLAGNLVGTGTKLVLNNVTQSQAGNYQCVVKNSTGSLNCNIATLTVDPSVKITSQPQDTSVNAGGSVSLTISAVGASLNYDWSKNGTSLGINSATLTLSNAGTSDEGTYSCRVWNDNSSATCASFTVAVNQGVKITAQPQPVSAYEGTSATLSVTATGKPTPTVDWYFNNTLVKSNSTTLSLPSLTLSQAGSYYCVVKNSVDSATCNSVKVDVLAKVKITKQLANQTLNEGDTIALDFAASGAGPITYRCYFNGQQIVSSTSVADLVIPSATTADSGSYNCSASNAGSSATTNTVQISVLAQTVTASAQIQWTAPTTRADGTPLASGDINGYEIFVADSATGPYSMALSTDANTTQGVVTGLSVGTHYIGIKTIDTNNMESAMSSPISLTIK